MGGHAISSLDKAQPTSISQGLYLTKFSNVASNTLLKEGYSLKEFNKPIPQASLNIVEKSRANLFSWRGQFSPQLIEVILNSYCLPNSVILDPFLGSGTVLLEAGNFRFEVYGFEINPAACILSSTYELINNPQRKKIVRKVREKIDLIFPFKILENNSQVQNLAEIFWEIRRDLDEESIKVFDTLVILLDVANNEITNQFIQAKFSSLVNVIEKFPYSEKPIRVGLSDARALPIKDKQVDFVVTSPPYINVFNYHQNYRKSAEILGWNLLKIAKSEIGSNRANRKNRFYTVVQYCIDIAATLKELARVTKTNARIVFIVGYESNVLGVPFYNADIIEKIGVKSGLFTKVLRQKREFKNKFGKTIREDIINFLNRDSQCCKSLLENVAREVAFDALTNGLSIVDSKNLEYLENAIDKVQDIDGTVVLTSSRQ